MLTLEEVKEDILNMMRDGKPRIFRRMQKQDPKGLDEWATAAAKIAMAEIKAETYPGESPYMIWSDLVPRLSSRWLATFGTTKEQEIQEPEPETNPEIMEQIDLLRGPDID